MLGLTLQNNNKVIGLLLVVGLPQKMHPKVRTVFFSTDAVVENNGNNRPPEMISLLDDDDDEEVGINE